MSISSKIESYGKNITDRWHTPGHKGLLWSDDITEIGNDGDIFPADEVIKAQKLAAEIFGAKAVRFLTGGSSMGVKAAILATDGDIIAAENSHRCVCEGAALAKRNVFKIENKTEFGLKKPLTIEQVKTALKKYPFAKAVVITSPDYFGRVCDSEIVKIVKDAGKILIADSAHGAHFPFRPDLFPCPFSMSADFCNMSAHKTLFSFTMGAYLCVNNEKFLAKTDEALKNLGTTSPLYPLLASLENAVISTMFQKGLYDNLKQYCDVFKKEIITLDNDDFSRLVVDAAQYKLTGKELFTKLYEKGIAAEMYTDRWVVFIATPADNKEKFERLTKAIKESF